MAIDDLVCLSGLVNFANQMEQLFPFLRNHAKEGPKHLYYQRVIDEFYKYVDESADELSSDKKGTTLKSLELCYDSQQNRIRDNDEIAAIMRKTRESIRQYQGRAFKKLTGIAVRRSYAVHRL